MRKFPLKQKFDDGLSDDEDYPGMKINKQNLNTSQPVSRMLYGAANNSKQTYPKSILKNGSNSKSASKASQMSFIQRQAIKREIHTDQMVKPFGTRNFNIL